MQKSTEPDVICLGEALIDFISLDTGIPMSDVSGFKKAPGGAPANVAAGLSKLGIKSAFIGKVGDDAFGRYLEKVLINAGIDTSQMLFDKTAKTGLAFVALSSDGIPEFMFYRNPSADMLLDKNEINAEFIGSAKIFHYGSITLITEPSRSATISAIEYANESGLVISYDPNLRRSLWPNDEYAKEIMLSVMKYPHIVKVSEEELKFLTGKKDIESGIKSMFNEYGNIKLLAVTKGAKGCYYATSTHSGEQSAFKVNVEDTTGAGDGFVAGMLSCIINQSISKDDISVLGNNDLTNIFKYASTVAGLTATKKGAITAMPNKNEVDILLKEHR